MQPITSPSIYTTSSNLACVIYTSETKGNFKGVMIEHKGIVNLVITQSKVFGLYDLKEVKNCLFYANYVFDSHVSEIFTSIFNGHKLHISNNIRLLSRYIEVNNINIATIPPILLNNQELLKLKILVVTGEKTSQEILDLLYLTLQSTY